jgi:adenosylcobinamide-phosphate synthase
MPLISNVELALAALLVEAAIGYPPIVYRAIGHPVTWIGAFLATLEKRLNRGVGNQASVALRARGAFALALLLAVTASATLALDRIVIFGPIATALLVTMSSTLIAQKSLYEHVRAVADALEREGLASGRLAVSKIVGRNPERLDEAGVARAAIESLAENFADGIVAPAFWIAIGGLPGGALYKTINTADSMIGHRTPRYVVFGWAAARLDDLVNLPASRLAALFLVMGAAAVGDSPSGAARAAWRDASRHRSPNAGWPEAAMAGALGLRLAGPRAYGEELVDDAFMGDGTPEATVADIRRALRLFRASCVVSWLVLFIIVLICRV